MERLQIAQRYEAAKKALNAAVGQVEADRVNTGGLSDPRVVAAQADQNAVERELALFDEGKPLESAHQRLAHAERRFDEASTAVQAAGRELHAATMAARELEAVA